MKASKARIPASAPGRVDVTESGYAPKMRTARGPVDKSGMGNTQSTQYTGVLAPDFEPAFHPVTHETQTDVEVPGPSGIMSRFPRMSRENAENRFFVQDEETAGDFRAKLVQGEQFPPGPGQIITDESMESITTDGKGRP